MVMLMNITERKRKCLMVNPFTKHPHSVGETYLEHMKKALKYSILLCTLSMVVFIHSVFPFWFETFTGDEIDKLNKEIQKKRQPK